MEGVKVREDWLVYVNLFYKESKSKKKYFFFFFIRGWGMRGKKKIGEMGWEDGARVSIFFNKNQIFFFFFF